MQSQLLPERSDVRLAGVAPKHLRKWVREIGGVTPWGENRYRLVLCQHVMTYCGARWHDWTPGTPLADQGGLEFSPEKRTSQYVMRDPADASKTVMVEAEVPAYVGVKKGNLERVVEEMRWIERYPNETGWMFQVWYPATYYSEEHYRITVAGRSDLPLLGEFPSKGQYERQFSYFDSEGEMRETFPTMPGESWMERAIQHHERKLADKANESPNVEWRMLATLSEARAARAAYEKKQREMLDQKIKDRIAPIFGSSMAAGRYREQLAERCRALGIRVGHVGN